MWGSRLRFIISYQIRPLHLCSLMLKHWLKRKQSCKILFIFCYRINFHNRQVAGQNRCHQRQLLLWHLSSVSGILLVYCQKASNFYKQKAKRKDMFFGTQCHSQRFHFDRSQWLFIYSFLCWAKRFPTYLSIALERKMNQ